MAEITDTGSRGASMESIGQVLAAQRERKGLSLEDVHEATKITPQNLSALEADSFDYFPNRVYARAFLRDYANFLGLDSSVLLSRYEDEWNPVAETPDVASVSRGSGWRVVGYSILVLVILAGLAIGGYFTWSSYQRKAAVREAPPSARKRTVEQGATLPKGGEVEPPKSEAAPKPQPESEPALVPPVPEKLTLDLTALRTVWARVKVDGQPGLEGYLGKGESKKFEATKSIYVRVGQANGVQAKLNGKPVSLGSTSSPVTHVFTAPQPAPEGEAPSPGPAPAPVGAGPS